jgi:hypothetical protein
MCFPMLSSKSIMTKIAIFVWTRNREKNRVSIIILTGNNNIRKLITRIVSQVGERRIIIKLKKREKAIMITNTKYIERAFRKRDRLMTSNNSKDLRKIKM